MSTQPDHSPETEASPAFREGEGEAVELQVEATDFEQSEEVRKMIMTSPFALPLPVDVLRENQVGVSEIPEAPLLNQYVGDLDVRICEKAPKLQLSSIDGFRRAPSPCRISHSHASMHELSVSRPDFSLISSSLASTNRGRNPNSRWYIRGVLHPSPVHVYIGAIATVMITWLVPAAGLSALLLILSGEMPERFGWVPPQLLWFPAAMMVVGLMYIIFGLSSKCEICYHKYFVYRPRKRSSNTQDKPALGQVIPMSLHMMVFRWFRCSHCGTPTRLKK